MFEFDTNPASVDALRKLPPERAVVLKTPNPPTNWLVPVMVVIIVVLVGIVIKSNWPQPDGEVTPDIKDKAVAIFYEDKDIPTYTKEQRYALNSTQVVQKIGTTPFLKVDNDDDLSRTSPVFQKMADLHKPKLPWIVIATGRRLVSEPVESEEQVLSLLEKNL